MTFLGVAASIVHAPNRSVEELLQRGALAIILKHELSPRYFQQVSVVS